MNDQSKRRPLRSVAIIGGGLSGAAVAFNLLQRGPAGLRVTIIEPRASLGSGLAYSTVDPVHRLNVPHVKMSLSTEVPLDFADWMQGPEAPLLPPHSATLAGQIFPPRQVFGRYVTDRLKPYLARGGLRHIRAIATSVHPDGRSYRISLSEDHPDLIADIVVLAVAHPVPALPSALNPIAGTASLIHDPFAVEALEAIRPDERVLVVGTGLTSADILATLDRRKHRGEVHVFSRHGLRSKPHGPAQAESSSDFTEDPPTTALSLLRRVRQALKADAQAGLTWHATFDRLRSQGPVIWSALSHEERKRFLRHLRGLWDVHRFRIAPPTLATVEQMERRRRARFLTGRLTACGVTEDGLRIDWRPRGKTTVNSLTVDRVVLATGPDNANVTRLNPLLRQATEVGLIEPDRLGLGIHVAPSGAARVGDTISSSIFVAGPLARGTAGELMGVPEITGWAEHVARHVLAQSATNLPFSGERAS